MQRVQHSLQQPHRQHLHHQQQQQQQQQSRKGMAAL
jgi:hypothetical protein